MRLSRLQKHILEKCYNYKSSWPTDFYDFYGEKTKSRKLVQDIIHKSLDSLVDKDLLSASGKKTARKWFIHKVKLTNLGRKLAIRIIKNKQCRLPIK
ncbi:MAG: hypothetical protein UU95_C0034G0017 [Parcubacteria group bacterium GW2011_GWC2_42_12]|uniref:Uncharacterized protein n=2 Tax=Candidatus Falkowiibacteriota TaxID=1752728 RepID=A0A1F5S9Q9_9BACT|nr:MAG: hypothetical protein UU43_C0010G0009 [Candidatus Falkowbacteria bacterium GW2011_GWA2_41_14]KKS33366.1 MAG: hypothetical protein UU95_C0034G0017 [Parcubacteria group bacterium GW2011_GWC2_42_12]OGF23379.1 MAG: hypothetical protein A3D45_02695 [Candidatus Falkowbacteria bacterium RIFCSPHIGHO2_02_FULL_42_9]